MCIEKQAEKIIWGEWCDYCGICGEEGFWYDDTEAMDQLEWIAKILYVLKDKSCNVIETYDYCMDKYGWIE